MGGQCHSTLGNACYPKRAEALDFRIVCLHFLVQLAHPRQGVRRGTIEHSRRAS
jgi:hypothetical protein